MSSKQIIRTARCIFWTGAVALVAGEALYFFVHGQLYASKWLLLFIGGVAMGGFGMAAWGLVAIDTEKESEDREEREQFAKDEVARRIAAALPDRTTASQLAIRSWNDTYPVGTLVTYEKLPLEGRLAFETTTPAYLLGDEAVVELEHIGIAPMAKLGPYPQY